ncbi:J domain-containing protein [Comamonas terrigena]|uniref:J domain-containing protein n=1 Tax=Comamonas terrigena TaxID=32013 RepID=UPI00244C0ADA|nr:J domain-containing protein [Comamonas terrigena]MDH1700617.1 J domain-containing protein [Comamonas terrigena]
MKNKDPKGYYAILGISLSADASEIKAAYRRKAMELHPDRNPSPNATSQFQLLNEALAILSDPSSRAQYDTIAIETHDSTASQAREEPPEPIVCSCCGKVSAQPRYAIFFSVKSFFLHSTRTAVQGIFCSACAEKKALVATATTWVLGWWGIPWGIIYSIQAIFNNMMGGTQPAHVNARLAAHQAWVFAALGKIDLARAVALDALALSKKVKSDTGIAKRKKSLGYDVPDEGVELQQQIHKLLEILGGGGAGRLTDTWGLFRRPFYIQMALTIAIISVIFYLNTSQPTHTRLQSSDPFVANRLPTSTPEPYVAAFKNPKPSYVRPASAPNGEAWPIHASYIKGYPQTHKSGYSKITIDNSQNDSDIFGKLVSLDGQNALPVQTFYIPARGRFTLDDITAGSYDIRYRNLHSGHLSRSELFTVEEHRIGDSVRFSNMTMTLYKVRNGNMQTYGLPEDEF